MSINKNIPTLFLLLLTSCFSWSQPVLNERVNLQPTNYTSLSNISIANDSTYIIIADGYDTSINKTYIKVLGIDIDLNIKWDFKIIDSSGNDSYFTADMLALNQSIDGSFIFSFNKNPSDTLNVIRFNSLGNILDTGIFKLYYPGDTTIMYSGFKAIESKNDSSIYIPTLNYSSSPSRISAIKLTKDLNLLNTVNYVEPNSSTNSSVLSNRIGRCPPKIYKDSLILLGGNRQYYDYIPNTIGSPDRKFRAFVRLCKMDGTPIHEWVDTNYMSTSPMGLVPLKNGNIMVVNSYGEYWRHDNSINHGMKLFCLDSNLNQLWEKRVDTVDLSPIGVPTFGKESQNMILTKDSCLVIVGRDTKTKFSQMKPPNDWDAQSYGRITKVNQQGEVLWDRYHYNLPFPEQPLSTGGQNLRDIKQTSDSGYIAVGTVTKFEDCQAGIIPCQFGWVLKTDKYGCIVPGCHLETEEPEEPQEPQDTTSPYKPTAPILLLYPNPANDVVHVYFRSSAFTDQGSIKIIDMQGNTVKDFTVFKNDMTYSVPIHDLAQGTYIIQYMTPDHTFKAKKLVIVR